MLTRLAVTVKRRRISLKTPIRYATPSENINMDLLEYEQPEPVKLIMITTIRSVQCICVFEADDNILYAAFGRDAGSLSGEPNTLKRRMDWKSGFGTSSSLFWMTPDGTHL